MSASVINRQTGLSLIELMIAMALGVVLLLGLVQIFSGVRVSFSSADSLARIQENSRFGLEFLRRDLRMAGHTGCLNEYRRFSAPSTRAYDRRGFVNHFINATTHTRDDVEYGARADVPIEVYDFAAAAATYTIPADASFLPPDDVAAWTPNLPANLGLEDRALRGSDIIVVRYFDEVPLNIAGFSRATGRITLRDADDAATIELNRIYALANCRLASLFQVTELSGLNIEIDAAPNTANSGAYWQAAEDAYGTGSQLHRYRMYAYYIGRRATTGEPGLWRRSLVNIDPATGNHVWLDEELVDGVEMLQATLGVSTSSPASEGEIVESYVKPAVHLAAPDASIDDAIEIENALRGVRTVRLSLLMRGTGSIAGAAPASPTVVVGDVTVTPPVDSRMRQSYQSLIAVRNRLRL